jgi:hypothetical protein
MAAVIIAADFVLYRQYTGTFRTTRRDACVRHVRHMSLAFGMGQLVLGGPGATSGESRSLLRRASTTADDRAWTAEIAARTARAVRRVAMPKE